MWWWTITAWNGPPWKFQGQISPFQGSVEQAETEHNNVWEDTGVRVTILLYWWKGKWFKYSQLGPGEDF